MSDSSSISKYYFGAIIALMTQTKITKHEKNRIYNTLNIDDNTLRINS